MYVITELLHTIENTDDTHPCIHNYQAGEKPQRVILCRSPTLGAETVSVSDSD